MTIHFEIDVSMEEIKTPRFNLKVVQLILAIVCTILNDYGLGSLNLTLHRVIFVYVVLCGYILILLMDLSRIVSGGKTAKPVELYWSFISGILWIIAGALIIATYSEVSRHQTQPGKNQFIAAGIISLLNGLAFFAEAAVIFKSG